MPTATGTTVPELTTFRWSSSAETDRFPVEDPATGQVIAVIQGGGPEQVDAAVEAAHRAFETDWRWRTPAERAAFLLRAADVLEEHADELALIESRENGKPVQDARQNDISFLIVARRIDVGMVFINNYFRGVIGTPFGGTKYSGYGREHAIETLREFTYTKMVRFPSGRGTIPSWRAVGDIFDDVA
ncbi:MAG: aldehyde dehydrogenase family protein [Streptosporangiaceae bacterium]